MTKLDAKIISSFNSAISKLTGHNRRLYAAELTNEYFDGSARKAERYLKVSREMIKLGLEELRSGIQCLGAFNQRGRKKKKKPM